MVFIKVFSVLLLAYIAPDRVMVRIFDRTVYGTVIGFLIGADQNIVYPEIEFIQIIGDAQSPAGLCKGVIQLLSQDAMVYEMEASLKSPQAIIVGICCLRWRRLPNPLAKNGWPMLPPVSLLIAGDPFLPSLRSGL